MDIYTYTVWNIQDMGPVLECRPVRMEMTDLWRSAIGWLYGTSPYWVVYTVEHGEIDGGSCCFINIMHDLT